MAAAEEVKRQMIRAIGEFEVNFVRAYLSTKGGAPHNFCVSTHSVWNGLFLLYLGAEKETKALLEEVLGITDLRTLGRSVLYSLKSLIAGQKSVCNKVQIEVLNRLFFDVSTNVDLVHWKSMVRDDVELLNFKLQPEASTDYINSWIEKGTKGKIPKMLNTPLDRDTVLILANTVYFKAKWKTVFSTYDTRDKDFFLSSGKKVTAPFMRQVEGYSVFDCDDMGATLISLPYQDPRYSFLIMLPYSDNMTEVLDDPKRTFVKVHARTQSMEGLCESLTRDRVRTAVKRLESIESILFLPKFKMEFECDLEDTLKKMKLESIFSEKCDFSSFTPSKFLVIKACQKTVIEVNEEGTEAVASFILKGGGGPPMSRILNVNRPFYFMIYDNELHTALFSGIFESPV